MKERAREREKERERAVWGRSVLLFTWMRAKW